ELGLKKTSIDDIVQACDIGKGSFYKFYTSKEELFFEIMKKEESNYQLVAESVVNSDKEGPELMTMLIKELLSFYQLNVFLQLFFERKELPLLLKKVPLEEVLLYSDEQRLKFVRLIEVLMNEKRIGDMRPEIVEAIVRSILILSVHKQEIGKEVYPEVMEYMIQFVGSGLGMVGRYNENDTN
ncbi:MAG TPA: TetR/AcrR family transcriptional regulator, partial [Pseudoneobacillus sp.]|nr:TetR/AcrR family transcriptional regulator [Pseudoneobacillus sp.]